MRDNQGSCHCGVKGRPQVRPGEHHTQCQGSTEKKAFEIREIEQGERLIER